MRRIILVISYFVFGLTAFGQIQSSMYVSGDINTWGATGMTYRNLVIPNWITTIQYTGTTGNQGFKFRNSQDNWTESWGRGDAVTIGSKTIWYDNGGNGTFNHQNGNFYTFIFRDVNNTTHSDGMVIETNAIPVTIVSTYRIPTIVYQYQKPVVYATLSDDLPTGQGVYVRYTTNSWTSSAIHEMTAVNTTLYRYELPASDIATELEYYFFTSGSGLTIPHADADLFTINLLNNSGSNYEYTVQAGTVRFSNAAANWSEASTWEGNSVPTSSDQVVIQHNVTLNENATVNSLLINKENTLTVNSTVNLTVNSELGNNNSLIINSDATGTGSLITNGTVSGDVTIQRYVVGDWSTNNSGWHLISSPVAVQPIVDFTTTGGGNGYDFYGYNEATNTWMNYKAAGFEAWNESANFAVGRGYSISYQATQTGKAFEGTLNNSNVTHTDLSLTAGQGEGWHLVGNPFASAIDWSNVNWVKTGFNAYAKVWQSSTSSYKDVTDDYSNIIPSANGFWVKASNATNTLTIPTQARTHNALNWLKSSAPIGYIILTANDTENDMSQECIIRVKDEATDGFDESFDAPFMAGNAPHIYTTVENRNLSMNSVPSYSNKTFEMGFVKNSASAFTIQLNMDNIAEGEVITLTDKKLNQSFELTKGLAYEFISEAGDDPNRFLIHFGTVGVDEAIPATAVAAYVSNNILYVLNAQGKVQADVLDLSGRLVHSQSLQANGLSSTPLNLPAGVYVVRLNDGQTSRTNKVIVQ